MTTGLVVWAAAIVVLMWPTSFMHFGGFCLDPDDVCVVRWPSRFAGLLLALGLVATGWLVTAPMDRWRQSRRSMGPAIRTR